MRIYKIRFGIFTRYTLAYIHNTFSTPLLFDFQTLTKQIKKPLTLAYFDRAVRTLYGT